MSKVMLMLAAYAIATCCVYEAYADTAVKRPITYYINQALEIQKKHCDRSNNVQPGAVEALDYLETVASDAAKLQLKPAEVAALWQAYAGGAQDLYRDDLFLKGYQAMMAANPAVTNIDVVAARLIPHYRALADMKKFPLAEKDIKFGQTLKSMGVVEKKTERLKDYWNPTNVTAAFQKLVDDPEVTTIVLDKMPTPWYIDSVKFHEKVNGKRVLFKSGCEVLRCPDRLRHRMTGKASAMFDVCSAKNLIIESDAAKPEEAHIGFYRDYAERAKYNKSEGASGIQIGGGTWRTITSENIVVRNLRIADCEQDGLFVGSNWRPPENIFIESVIFDSNFRQGSSPCTYYSLYFKNCKFINTRGGQPMAGCDVEPWADYLSTVHLYFFDCTFENNGGGGLLFATSTRDPILCLIKRCKFLPTGGSQFNICARLTGYIAADGKPYSNIIVEDSEFISRGSTFVFTPCPIYDVTVKNCVIRDARRPGAKARSKKGPSPILLSLNRDLGQPDMTDNIRPKVTFENVRIEGFETSDPLGISDEIGKLNIKGVFAGKVNWNGRYVDLSSCNYQAPDIAEKKNEFADLKTLIKPRQIAAADAAMPDSNAELCFAGAWWLKAPNHSYYFWADKGRAVSFDFDLRYPNHLKNVTTNKLTVVSTSGKEVPIGEVTRGVKRLTYTAPETGWHRFTPGPVLDKGMINNGIKWYVSNVRGARFAWQADTQSDCFAKFFLKDKAKDYTGYFEVPAGGKECRLRVSFGGFELYDPAGNLVEKVNASDYLGRHILKIRPSTGKAEIWRFKTPCTVEGGSYMRALRFYLPLNGIWADTPEDLPCVYAEHHVPAKIADAAGAGEWHFLEKRDVTVKDAAVSGVKGPCVKFGKNDNWGYVKGWKNGNIRFEGAKFVDIEGSAVEVLGIDGDVVFSNCMFERTTAATVAMKPDYRNAFKRGTKPKGRLVFENCRFEGYSDVPVFTAEPYPMFDVTLKDCTIMRRGKKPGSTVNCKVPAIELLSWYDFGAADLSAALKGGFTISGLNTEGGVEGDLVGVRDELGQTDFRGIFKGVDFEYSAPDRGLERLKRLYPQDLEPPEGTEAEIVPSAFRITWNGSYAVKPPQYSYYFAAGKDAQIAFSLVYPGGGEKGREDFAKRYEGMQLKLATPSGGEKNLGPIVPGRNDYAFTVAESGWYSFKNPQQAIVPLEARVVDFKGAQLSYQADTEGYSLAKFELADRSRAATGYFEVPGGGRECKLAVMWGDLELRNPKGEIVASVGANDYFGRHVFTIKPTSDESGVWSFTAKGPGTHVLRFYAPLNGVWADTPKSLPRLRGKRLENMGKRL